MILNNVRLIDGTGRVWEQASIRIKGDRIVAVSEAMASATDEETLDLKGKTAMPGLINCHAHLCLDGSADPITACRQRSLTENVLFAAKHAEATLRAGITTVRDLGGWRGIDLGLKKAINDRLHRARLFPGRRGD